MASKSGTTRQQQNPHQLLQLCRKHNNAIISVLQQYAQKNKDDVTELLRTTQRVQEYLHRCMTAYGDLSSYPLKTVEDVYVAICKHEERISKLEKGKSFARFITQSRLRSKIDKSTNSICVMVEKLEQTLKEFKLSQITNVNTEEFTALLEEIENKSGGKAKGAFSVFSSMDISQNITDNETLEKAENALSIVSDPEHRRRLLKDIPMLPVKPLAVSDDSGNPPAEILTIASTDNNENEVSFSDYVSGQSLSTYPIDEKTGKREGDPICDQYCCTHYENRTFAAVADGCSWGPEPKEAARKASRMFSAFMKRHQHLITDTRICASLILRAYLAAHKAIVQGATEENMWHLGTTTMLAGCLLQLEKPVDGKGMVFVCASIGDCKAYHYSPKTGHMKEITVGNRGNHDPRDPGGRIGPHKEGGAPDLRNLILYNYFCEDGDLICIVSDGVHDNFDVRQLGKSPRDVGIDAEKWEQVKDTDENQQKVDQWQEDFINRMLPKSTVTPSSITQAFVRHSLDTTVPTRTFFKENPGKRLPSDYVKYPGKIDHTTCLAFKVGLKKSLRQSGKKIDLHSPQHAMGSSPSNNELTSFYENEDLNNAHVIESPAVAAPAEPHETHPEEKESLDDNAVWDSLFGGETYVVEWRDFIRRLPFKVSEEEERQLVTIIDYSMTKSVTRYKFSEFLKGFGPLDRCLENVKKVVGAEWFFGFISATESKKFLEQQPVGTFLVRFSGSRPGAFVLDYLREPLKVRSVRLTSHPNGGFSALIEGGKERVFKSLHDVIETYTAMNVLIHPFSSDLPEKEWFYGDISAEEAETLLEGQRFGTFLIRFSNQTGCFAASFAGEKGEIKKGLITKASGGWQVKNQGMIFKSLDELVDHYKQQNIFTVPCQS